MLLRRPRLLALLLLGWSCLAHGELDEIHSRLLAPYAVPLRWDNIEAAPAWLGGVQPVYRKDKGYHTVRLTLGEWTEVRVAAGEQLRLTTVEGAFTPSDLRLMRANGRGLYAEVMPQPSSDRRHWLVGAETAAASIYRLEHIGQDSGPLEIALFASRHTPLGELAPYRQVLPLPGQAVSLRAAAVAAAQTYWRLESDQPIALKVTGPRRLALDNRMLYPASESGLLQSWRVQCWLDDRPLHTAEMESNVESRQEVFVDRASTVVSRAERFYLEIPSGEHHLRLRASAPLLARLLAQASTDYLFPELNQPRLTAEAARADLDPDEAGRSSWQRGPREIAAAALATANVSAVEHAALRLAMDTRWREGGSVGAALLAQAALARPEDQTLATRARHFSGAHTFFRDLLPVAKIESAAMTYRWFRLPHLLEPGQEVRNLVVAAQHREALLDRLGSGYFITLPPHGPVMPAIATPPFPAVQSVVPESVREVIQFEPYSARLTQAARARLRALAQRQRQLAGGLLEIRGYTASDKVSAYNQRLSQQRAAAVAEALATLGLKARIVKATGRGIADPVADNASRNGRQQNRRVEITWQPPAAHPPPPVAAPMPRADGARYLLPPAYAPRTLRLVAYGEAEAEFFLQIDQQAPRRLRFAPRDRLPDAAFAPSPGEGGLLLQRLGDDVRGDGSMSPAFGRYRVAAPMVAAASIELILPATSREIRLWRADAAAGGLRVAVQYQAAAAFQLSEREFLSLFNLDQDSGLPLRLALRAGWQEADGAGPEQLASQWRPLARLLLAELRQAAAGVRAPAAAEHKAPVAGDAAQRARAAAAQGQWLLALEEWSRVWFAHSRGAEREAAEWGRIDALGQLGEDFMYEQLLKQILLFDPDPERRGHALDRLEKHYASAGSDEARLRLYAIAVQRQPNALAYWRKLTQVLLEQGEYRLALLAGLALPPRQRPIEALLEASWRLRWWQTFDRLRLDLEDVERRAFWQGMRAAATDEFETVRRLWRAAGNDGRVFADHLGRALALRQATEHDSLLSAEAYGRWAELRSQAPGPRRWRDAPEYVSDFAGALPGYAIDRDLHFSLYKASAERPLRLTVTGPARLRLDARPIHASAMGGNLEGWLTARSVQGLWVAPIIANQANTGLQLADGTWVGRKVALDIPVAAGRQSIEVAAGALTIAVRVYVEQPALPLGVLPTPSWLAAEDRLAERLGFEPVESTWPRPCEGCLIVPDSDPQQPSRRYRRVISPSPPPPTHLAEAPIAEHEARLLAENDFDRLLAGLPLTPAPPEQVLKRLVWLLWIAETSPPHAERALAAGQGLAAANPGVAGLARLVDRLTRNSGWSAQEMAQESAGVRLLPVAGWQPESPSSRLQKALLPPLAEDEQVIGGHTRLLLSLRHGKKGWIDFELRPEDLGGLPAQPLQVAVQRDDEAPRLITLAPDDDWQAHRLDMPAGHHALRVWLPSPVANQLLRLRLRERRGQAIVQQFERPYQIATAAQPLRAQLPGPAWLRVDEWRAGQTHSRYQLLSEPWQTVTLSPAAGQREALFRLHLRSTLPPRPAVPPRPLVTATVAVPPPLLHLDDPVVAARVHLVDAFTLGGQEDGSWTLSAGAHSRYDADSDAAEKYIEGALTHRYYDPARRTYFTTQGLLRLRAAGDPTLGLTVRADRHLDPWPLDAFAEASAYAQTLPFTGNDWSAHLKAGLSQHRDIDPKTWHTPWLTVYARKTGAGDALHPEQVDQDIHTRYQAQHRFGYEIGDRLSYRPWLDSLLQAGIGVTSNQNLVTPDKARVAVQWQQLLGRWQADTHAAWTHYFDDADRAGPLDRRELGLRLAWEGWRPNQDRLEALFDLTHHVDTGFTAGWLGLRWHLENGRGYRDWPPGTVDFRDLRQRNQPDHPNNRIEAGEP